MSDLATGISSADLPPPYPADELLRGLLEVSLTGIALYTPLRDAAGALVDFTIDLLNPAAQRMLGQPARPSGTYLQHYPHTLDTGVFAFHRDAFESGTPAQFEVNYQGDGLDNYFHLAAQRVGPGLLVSFTDTGHEPRTAVELALRASQAHAQQARTDAELALHQSQQHQELLAHTLGQVPAAVATLRGPEHRFVYLNDQYRELTAGRAAVGQTVAELLPEVVGQGFIGLLDGVYTTGQPYVGQETPIQLLDANGRPAQRYLDFLYQSLTDDQGKRQGILVFAVDVTEKVQARHHVQELNEELATINEELTASNEEYLLANTALAESQQSLRELNQQLEARVQERTQQLERQQGALQRIFQQAPVPITVLRGPTFRIEQANEAISAIWGQPLTEALGRPYFEAIAGVAGQGFEELLTGVLQTGQPLHLREAPVTLDRPHSGRPAQGYFDFTFQPLFDEQQASGLVAIGTEVTDQVLARRQVQDLNEELAAINEELMASNGELSDTNRQLTRTNADLDNFIYTASHDLKAPISNIEGLLRLLEDLLPDELRTDDTLRPVLIRMQEAVERFTRTIGHLTDVSKLQLEFAHPAVPTPLAPLLDDMRQDLAPLLAKTGGHLEANISACPTLFISEKNLRSVLYNLVSNALKYRHPDRPPVVHLSCRLEADRCVLRVQDNGLGLSDWQQAKLFQLFGRLHTHVEGTGVGLYMVKKMVENAHGTLTVESREGEGTTFTASFPA